MTSWRNVDPSRASSLGAARDELHWAAQIPSAAGATLLEARDDFGHTNLGWCAAEAALVSHPLGDDRLRAGVRLPDLSLVVLDPHDAVLYARSLVGRTLDEGLRALTQALTDHGGPALSRPLSRPGHELPEHPIGGGEPFAGVGDAARPLLGDWFHDAHVALVEIADGQDGAASEVRCWPHHFDIATLLTLDAGTDPEAARSIGVGMTPGDGQHAAPYFYVTPWPYPDASAALPELPPGGRWNTEGWTGAVLGAADLDGADQAGQVRRFLTGAVAACRTLLEAGPAAST